MAEEKLNEMNLRACDGCNASGFGVVGHDGFCATCRRAKEKGRATKNERRQERKAVLSSLTQSEKSSLSRLDTERSSTVISQMAGELAQKRAEEERVNRERALLAEALAEKTRQAEELEAAERQALATAQAAAETESDARRKRLLEVKARLLEGRGVTHAAVKEDKEGKEVIGEREWRARDRKEREEAELAALAAAGVAKEKVKLLTTAAVNADFNRQKAEAKRAKEALKKNPPRADTDEAHYQSYEKRATAASHNNAAAGLTRVGNQDQDDLAASTAVSADRADALAADLKLRSEKNKRKRVETDVFYEHTDISYISKDNARYNKTLSKQMDKYSADIKASLERGSAL